MRLNSICLIDCRPDIVEHFRALVPRVLAFKPGLEEYIFDLPAALEESGISPDAIVQQENLTRRVLVAGLGNYDCPKLFWGLDPHLNAHWQAYYARLFDLTCSTQKRSIPDLRLRGAADVRWLPWFAPAGGEWVPWSKREHKIAFVGRITPQRPAREWMVDLLKTQFKEAQPAIRDGLAFNEMLDLYRHSMLAPNETIFNETNLRLFEAAACGCLVFNPDTGEEMEGLFEPGKEVEVFDTIADLRELLTQHLADTRRAQAMGRAAFERTQTEHRMEHRVKRMHDYLRDAGSHAASGDEENKWFWLSAFALLEAGLCGIPATTVLREITALKQDADVTTALLRAQTGSGSRETLGNMQVILAGKLHEHSLDINVAGSMLALRNAQEQAFWDCAKTFWYRHLQTTGTTAPQPPQDAQHLYLLWARELRKQGRILKSGFAFDPKRHLPSTAVECLMAVLHQEPQHLEALQLLEAMTRDIRGLEQSRVGYLSILTLFKRNDWRMGLELALANLRAFRLQPGLEELAVARSLAREQGQQAHFERSLKARDPWGRLRRLLGED